VLAPQGAFRLGPQVVQEVVHKACPRIGTWLSCCAIMAELLWHDAVLQLPVDGKIAEAAAVLPVTNSLCNAHASHSRALGPPAVTWSYQQLSDSW